MRIVIYGHPGEGKTSLAHLLMAWMHDAGMTGEYQDPDSDVRSGILSHTILQRIRARLEGKTIQIEENITKPTPSVREGLVMVARKQQKDLPPGVSEHAYATAAEMTAFINGVNLAEDLDVECSEPFARDGRYVVRVRVGDFPDQ